MNFLSNELISNIIYKNIVNEYNINPCSIILICNNRKLDENQTLAMNGVEDQSHIKIISDVYVGF